MSNEACEETLRYTPFDRNSPSFFLLSVYGTCDSCELQTGNRKLEDFLSLFDKIGMTMIGKLDLHKLYFNFVCTCRHNILYLVIDYEKNIIGKRQQYTTFYFFIFGATGVL